MTTMTPHQRGVARLLLTTIVIACSHGMVSVAVPLVPPLTLAGRVGVVLVPLGVSCVTASSKRTWVHTVGLLVLSLTGPRP